MSHLYRIAKRWNSAKLSDEERNKLKSVVSKMAGYNCKIACDCDDGLVDIHVFSENEGRVTDWLDLQENGAFGLLDDMYRDKNRPLNRALQERCDEYNTENDLVYGEEDDEESDEESEYSGESDDEDDDDDDESDASTSDDEGK